CLEILQENGIEGWRLATAYEALARASSVAGDREAASAWKSRAEAALGDIADDEDREVIERDLSTLPL
ncbi:MAG TPA: hypothetical protein VFM19_08820, partial [Candidatus Limnocylindria bacterium]|nr:hypothetical protein [Candidatus Limnocylindria bacterium]